MRKSTSRRRWLARAVVMTISLVGALLLAELSAALYFAGDRHGFESMRRRLAGADLPPGRFLAQPYLLYTVRPGTYGKNFHNRQGYRGREVPLARTEGVARVLCLGGSTTYGYAVEDPELAYPAQLEQILAEDLPSGLQGVQVINAGLPFATTAELLTHYHFKFHFFQPDLVIINTGGNESVLIDETEVNSTAKYYQPDYSHWRRSFTVPEPLSPFGQLLMKSRLASWMIILAIYGEQPGNAAITRPPGLPPTTTWHPAATEPGKVASLADDELAFTHNLSTLIDMCQRDGAQVLLVPFRLAPSHQQSPGAKADDRHEAIMQRIADQRGLSLAPFPSNVISPANWIDDCHVNAEGCRQKAEHIAQYARPLLEK